MEHITVNLNSIANVLGVISDTVQQFLNKMKETIILLCTQNKRTISLNLSFGHLWFFPDSKIEFKVIDGNKEILKPSDNISKADKASVVPKSKGASHA